MPNALARPEQTISSLTINNGCRPIERQFISPTSATDTYQSSHQAKLAQLCALLDFLRVPAVREALECASASVQDGITSLALELQAEAFARVAAS